MMKDSLQLGCGNVDVNFCEKKKGTRPLPPLFKERHFPCHVLSHACSDRRALGVPARGITSLR